MFPLCAIRLAVFIRHIASLKQVHIRAPHRGPNPRLLIGLLVLVTAGLVHADTPTWERLHEQTGPFILALARDKEGCIWIGTEDKGVFRYNPSAEETLQWRQFTSRDGLGDDNGYALACDKLGRVWVGTRNHGVSVYNGDKWKSYDVLDGPLGERIFALAACPTDGDVWMATSAGLARYSLDKDAWSYYTRADGLPSDQANALAFDKEGTLYVGMHGGGLARTDPASRFTPGKTPTKSRGDSAEKAPPLPKPAASPTIEELQELKKRVEVLAKDKKDKPEPAYLGEDWTTRGDWVGRYGRQVAMLCAMASPLNHEMGWDARFVIQGMIGPHCTKDDGLRHWVHWAKTDNPNSLYTPVAGYRRQAEWDDHGEAYPRTYDGPDLWVAVEVPAGTYRLSLYFFNKDGHDGMNRVRDYLVQLKPYTKDPRQAEKAVPLASCRVRQFWGGVYKQFVVPGPAKYLVKIGKNDSFNTLCSAVLLDRLRGRKVWQDDEPLPYMNGIPYKPLEDVMELNPTTLQAYTAWEVWKALDDAYEVPRAAARHNSLRRLLYRAAYDDKAYRLLLRYWRWRLPLWTDEDRKEWQAVMKKAREAEPQPPQGDDK